MRIAYSRIGQDRRRRCIRLPTSSRKGSKTPDEFHLQSQDSVQGIGKCLHFQVTKRLAEFTFKLTPHTILSWNHVVWDILRLNDCDGIQAMLLSRSVDIYTVNEDGRSLLDVSLKATHSKATNMDQYAVGFRSPDMCTILINEGCLPTLTKLERHFTHWHDELYTDRKDVELAHLLLSNGSHILIEGPEIFFVDSTSRAFQCRRVLEVLLPHIYPPFWERSLDERARYVMLASPETFCLFLGKRITDSQMALVVERAMLANTSVWRTSNS
jgi:hypothetical protein